MIIVFCYKLPSGPQDLPEGNFAEQAKVLQ